MTQFYPETNIVTLPALYYFAFYRQYRIFESGALPYFQKTNQLKNDVLTLLRQKDSVENIMIKLENSKIGLFDALQIEIRPLLAYACLVLKQNFEGKIMPVDCNVGNDKELENLAIEIYDNVDLPYLHLITEIGLISEKLQRQLTKAFPTLFEVDIAPFSAVQDAIKRMDIENENSLLEELANIQAVFLQAHKPLALISEEQNFDDAYWTEIFKLAEKLDMSQEDLRKNSISYFYAKLQNRHDANKQMEAINNKI